MSVREYVDVCTICVVYQEVGVDSILVCGRVLYISIWTCAECVVYQAGGVSCISVCGSVCGRVQNISMWTCR